VKLSSRYIVGIDLGTTNSVLAYVEAQADAEPVIQVFDVSQLIAPGEIAALPTLPSFLYFPSQHDEASGDLSLPWDERPQSLAGVMAREQGALTPGRQVSSAKSWLCNPGVDRRAGLLPPDAEAGSPKISPVEASSRYLIHLRNAWNFSHELTLEEQEIVLTVPASFDAEARELTVEAAQKAGLKNLILLEEPLAAFYAWIHTHQRALSQELRAGDQVLICDVGGGTTDFSMVRAGSVSGDVQLERTAIGEHLLLGGDNVDFALARLVEEKLGRPRLSPRQRHALRRACCSAKERLLSDASMERLPVTVLGGGRAVVGGTLSAELTRGEVIEVLANGFLPLTPAGEMPKQGGRRTALREMGLQYANDPAVTRHLAEFLTLAAAAAQCEPGAVPQQSARMQRPDAILFNGGFFASELPRDRVVQAVAGWFDTEKAWRPRVLHNEMVEAAVATGAVYYGRVRKGEGLRIRAGSSRTYYIGLRPVSAGPEELPLAVCVLPSGVEEGTSLALERDFSVLANRPAAFTLYSSISRCDPHGNVVKLDADDIHRHAPLVTLLRYGKKLRTLELAVRLRASFTEVGTLELWCEAVGAPHRWRLQFELRADEGERDQERSLPTVPQSGAQDHLAAALDLIPAVFGRTGSDDEDIAPDALVGRLEDALHARRDSWPLSAIRSLGDSLMKAAEGRRKSARHEVRWLNLLGFCLRPGFGAPQDEQRLGQVRNLYRSGLAFPDDLQAKVEWLVLWRRIAGGLTASHEHELQRWADGLVGGRGSKKIRTNRQVEQEGWRLLASLEQLPASARAGLGRQLIAKVKKEPDVQAWVWSLGRLGARIPLYGPPGCVVPAAVAEEWAAVLLQRAEITSDAAFALALQASRTGDAQRDLNDKLRREVIARLTQAQAEAEWIQRVKQYVAPTRSEIARMLGESLPKGLNFVSSPGCVLPLTGLLAEDVASSDKEASNY
jgi:hypothetical protein